MLLNFMLLYAVTPADASKPHVTHQSNDKKKSKPHIFTRLKQRYNEMALLKELTKKESKVRNQLIHDLRPILTKAVHTALNHIQSKESGFKDKAHLAVMKAGVSVSHIVPNSLITQHIDHFIKNLPTMITQAMKKKIGSFFQTEIAEEKKEPSSKIKLWGRQALRDGLWIALTEIQENPKMEHTPLLRLARFLLRYANGHKDKLIPVSKEEKTWAADKEKKRQEKAAPVIEAKWKQIKEEKKQRQAEAKEHEVQFHRGTQEAFDASIQQQEHIVKVKVQHLRRVVGTTHQPFALLIYHDFQELSKHHGVAFDPIFSKSLITNLVMQMTGNQDAVQLVSQILDSPTHKLATKETALLKQINTNLASDQYNDALVKIYTEYLSHLAKK